MSLDSELPINNLEIGSDVDGDANVTEYDASQTEAKPVDLDNMREALSSASLNEDGKRRLEALISAKEVGKDKTAKEFGVSSHTLQRWQYIYEKANGDVTHLNNATNELLTTKEEIQKVLDLKIPEDTYVTTATHPEEDTEYTVVDVETLKHITHAGLEYRGHKITQELMAFGLLERHKDSVVLTKEQLENNDFNAKPLFYYPKSVEAATNNIDIADAEFHLPIWELTDHGVFESRDSIHPTENGDVLTDFETKAALILFHPEYGDGRRDKDRRLMIKNPEYDPNNPSSQKREPFSYDLCGKFGLLSRLAKTNDYTSRTLREGMEAELPHLLENKELFLTDIRQVLQNPEDFSPEEYDAKPVGSNAYAMFGSVNHYIGRKFAGDTAKPFSKQRASVTRDVNGEQVLVAAFNLIARENASAESTGKDSKKVARANGSETQPKEIKYEKLIPRGQGGLQDALRESKIHEIQRLVTDRFTDLVTEANRAEELVASEANDLTVPQKTELAEQVKSLLLKQAERVIDIAVAATDAESLKEDLETFTFDKRAFVSLLQAVGAEKMLSNPLREVPAGELTEPQKERMIELLRQNYESLYPGEEAEEFRTAVLESLQKSFANPKTSFYVLEDGDEIVSFNRFDSIQDSTEKEITYFGSFNATPTYRGVGGVMLEETIKDQLESGHPMMAYSDPDQAITKKYIESGFTATGLHEFGGKILLEIWRSESIEDDLATKQLSNEQLVALANQSPDLEDDFFVRELKADDSFEELDSGLSYLLTRYFTHQGKTYGAFEINTRLSREFSMTQDELKTAA